MIFSIIQSLFLILFILGVWLLFTGLRPRSSSAEPRCASCNYDLRDMPIPAGCEGSVCPECGRDLSVFGAVRRDRRHRRGKRAAAGTSLIVLGLAPVIGANVGDALYGDPEKFTPNWVLHHRANQADRWAVEELARRIRQGTIDRDRVQKLVDQGLAWQRGVTRGGTPLDEIVPWSGAADPLHPGSALMLEGGWPLLLEAAALGGYMRPAQVSLFLEQGVLLECFSSSDGATHVQLLVLLGPSLNRLVAVDGVSVNGIVRHWGSAAQSGGLHGRSWSFELSESNHPADLICKIDASRVLDTLGVPAEIATSFRIKPAVVTSNSQTETVHTGLWRPLAPP